MLGVRRTSVTFDAHALQHAGLIKYSRGKIQILDVDGLHEGACECYETVRSQYAAALAAVEAHAVSTKSSSFSKLAAADQAIAKGKADGVDTSAFSEPELIHWPSFDQRVISGFLYRPPARFQGKRPVLISIHGGPEDQFTPYYLGNWNYNAKVRNHIVVA